MGGRSLMWMPAQTTAPPRSRARSAWRTSGPTGAKMIAASSGSGGASSDAPAHTAPSSRASGGAEAVEAEALGVAAEAQCAIADEAGAEQRRGLVVRVAVGQGEAVAVVGDRVLGVAAVDVAPGEPGLRAEVLAARNAEPAPAARPAEPGHTDAAAGIELGPRSRLHDRRHDLVPQHPGRRRHLDLAVKEMQIGAAHPACVHAEVPVPEPPAAARPSGPAASPASRPSLP